MTKECTDAIAALKHHLVRTPVLAYPRFDPQASEFVLQTAVGLGAVLEQDGHTIAYASQSLTSAEHHYSVIQRERLAVVYALKQFRHYLLGRRFQLLTDHAPLQWLSAQKMEGRNALSVGYSYAGIQLSNCLSEGFPEYQCRCSLSSLSMPSLLYHRSPCSSTTQWHNCQGVPSTFAIQHSSSQLRLESTPIATISTVMGSTPDR